MPKATVKFKACLFDAPDYGSTEHQIVSRIFFDYVCGENYRHDLFVEVRQQRQESGEAPIEITGPDAVQDLIDIVPFRDAIESYHHVITGIPTEPAQSTDDQLPMRRRDAYVNLPAAVEIPLDLSC